MRTPTHTIWISSFTLLEFLCFHSCFSPNILICEDFHDILKQLAPAEIWKWWRLMTVIKEELCRARHCSEHLMYVSSCNPHTNHLQGLDSFNFYRWGNPGTEKLNNLLKVTELTSGRTVIIPIQAAWLQRPNA